MSKLSQPDQRARQCKQLGKIQRHILRRLSREGAEECQRKLFVSIRYVLIDALLTQSNCCAIAFCQHVETQCAEIPLAQECLCVRIVFGDGPELAVELSRMLKDRFGIRTEAINIVDFWLEAWSFEEGIVCLQMLCRVEPSFTPEIVFVAVGVLEREKLRHVENRPFLIVCEPHLLNVTVKNYV